MREAELGKGKSLLSKDAVSDSSFSLTPQGALGHQLHLGWSFLEAKESAFCNPPPSLVSVTHWLCIAQVCVSSQGRQLPFAKSNSPEREGS